MNQPFSKRNILFKIQPWRGGFHDVSCVFSLGIFFEPNDEGGCALANSNILVCGGIGLLNLTVRASTIDSDYFDEAILWIALAHVQDCSGIMRQDFSVISIVISQTDSPSSTHWNMVSMGTDSAENRSRIPKPPRCSELAPPCGTDRRLACTLHMRDSTKVATESILAVTFHRIFIAYSIMIHVDLGRSPSVKSCVDGG